MILQTNGPQNTMSPKPFMREMTPPILWRLASRVAGSLRPKQEGADGKEQSNEYYDAIYQDLAEYRKHYTDSMYYFLWCVLIDRIQPENVRCILDVGCGPGQFAAFLNDRGLRKYVGLDFSPECIRMAQKACPSYEFVCGDAFESDLFETLDYDVLVTTEFLEHIDNDLTILNRIRPGTRVYASVPNFPHKGHVRHFHSVEEVAQRYGGFFDNFRVDDFARGSKGHRFFLFEGIRRA